jgi:hypothetical protein
LARNAGQWQAVTINLTPDPTLDQSPTMSRTELRASGSLASIFALRMLGLFLVLPVFALEARKYPGGDDPALIGLAMGIYGLTQGLLQIPFGVASDRMGRKRVIIFGLLIFVFSILSYILFMVLASSTLETQAWLLSETIEIILLLLAFVITCYSFFKVRIYYQIAKPQINTFDIALEKPHLFHKIFRLYTQSGGIFLVI